MPAGKRSIREEPEELNPRARKSPRRTRRSTAAAAAQASAAAARAAERTTLKTPPETPRATPPPPDTQHQQQQQQQRPPNTQPQQHQAPPSSTASNNTRCSDRINSSYTASIPPPSNPTIKMEETTEADGVCARNGAQNDDRQPTVNWDCVSYVVSDQKVHTSYEKPEMAPPVVDAQTGKTTTRVASYGKMVTKTVTMTVTTTIATTEILRPGEKGYQESLERQKRQQNQTPAERERQQREYHQSRQWASGDRTLHEKFHCSHHRSAQPARANV